MQPSPAMFIGDALAMDFLNSVATPIDTPVDWLDDGEGLLRWLEQAGLVPAETLQGIRTHPGELDAMADQARQLREWFRGFVREHKGQTLSADALLALEPLNRLLERDERFSRIVADSGGLELKTKRRWRSPEALLSPVAETLATFVCEESFADEGLRGAGLHAAVRRPHARPKAPLVQHGAVRQPRQAGRPPAAAQGALGQQAENGCAGLFHISAKRSNSNQAVCLHSTWRRAQAGSAPHRDGHRRNATPARSRRNRRPATTNRG